MKISTINSKIIILFSIVFFSFQLKQHHYSTSKVDFYTLKDKSEGWIYNNSKEQTDFFIFNSDFTKMEWINPGDKAIFLLTNLQTGDNNVKVWDAFDSKGRKSNVVLKESNNEIRIINTIEFDGTDYLVAMSFSIKKSWETNYFPIKE